MTNAVIITERRSARISVTHLRCGHNLERLGDRVTSIAERVIFMTTGTLKELNV
ncbi:MAG: hypothetical protein ACT4QE_15190 [Anaerolineales bacterium]